MKTETELKIIDASTQIKLAMANRHDEGIFRSCLNSFISTARSITFVMESESSDPELKSWYKCQTAVLGATPLFKFFNQQRVYTVHKGVISPTKFAHPVTDASFQQVADEDGNLRWTGTVRIPLGKNLEPISAKPEDRDYISYWLFDDVSEFLPAHSGNVDSLCKQYFQALKVLVKGWLGKRRELGLPC
ncbi:MAG: hypothetical protein J5J00_15400 [Deltaproteobacteria bacterium]|nr:hypothetical protein [Deltaproteobacteria bacterium]